MTLPPSPRPTEITAPTLAIVGAEDLPDMLNITRLLAERIPNAQQVVIADTAHLPSMEKPEQVNRLLHSFLNAL